jgi:hypothetical protein
MVESYRLQKRICYKLNVKHDPKGYWESNRELVPKKEQCHRSGVYKKMEGM